MSRVESTMLELGSNLPQFDLQLVNKDFLGSKNSNFTNLMLSNKPLLIMFICAHCPFVKHIEAAITTLFHDLGSQNQFLAISSNSVETHPEDSPDNLVLQSIKNSWRFPYLYDADQSFAKSLKAACTPDFFLFKPSNYTCFELVYRGQLDSSRPGNNVESNGQDIRKAIQVLKTEKKITLSQIPSLGCNIKWHPGKEPSWYG